MYKYDNVINQVADTLVKASTTFTDDKIKAYSKAIECETQPQSKWVLNQILENANAAKRNRCPLCDDTGIPHLLLEIGPKCYIDGELLDAINNGIAKGLSILPGRPMGLMGDDYHRLDQSGGIDPNPSGVLPAPILTRKIDKNIIRLHILMFGGGPAIRAKTFRVFHRHNTNNVIDEIVSWAKESTAQLGCTPCTLAIGVGRSHYEASSLMVQALVDGNYGQQSELEKQITFKVNESKIGALGLHGDTTVLGTFLKVGPQRASGVRIVCLRPCCCFEPRIASIDLEV